MKTKTCNKCGLELPRTQFYKHKKNTDGLLGQCKACIRAGVTANREANADYYREYDKQRFQNDPNVRARHLRYSKTKRGKASLQKSRKKWEDINPEKKAAHTILRNRIRAGSVVKPNICSACGNGGRIEGHHEDYSKPLDVIWLCRQCHVNVHKDDGQCQQSPA